MFFCGVDERGTKEGLLDCTLFLNRFDGEYLGVVRGEEGLKEGILVGVERGEVGLGDGRRFKEDDNNGGDDNNGKGTDDKVEDETEENEETGSGKIDSKSNPLSIFSEVESIV